MSVELLILIRKCRAAKSKVDTMHASARREIVLSSSERAKPVSHTDHAPRPNSCLCRNTAHPPTGMCVCVVSIGRHACAARGHRSMTDYAACVIRNMRRFRSTGENVQFLNRHISVVPWNFSILFSLSRTPRRDLHLARRMFDGRKTLQH